MGEQDFSFVKQKPAPRYDGYVTVPAFLGRLGEWFSLASWKPSKAAVE